MSKITLQSQNQPLVELQKISKHYKNRRLFTNINLKIKSGERIGIVGPNGTGKTTLCEIIAGIKKPTCGHVITADHARFGFQFQEEKVFEKFSALNYLKMSYQAEGKKINPAKIQQQLKQLKCTDNFTRNLKILSGGERQKLNIFLALSHNPNLVILDELGAGLDLETKDSIYDYLQSRLKKHKEMTLIMISHDMMEIQKLCQTLVFIENEKIIFKNIQEILKTYTCLEDYVREKFRDYYANKK